MNCRGSKEEGQKEAGWRVDGAEALLLLGSLAALYESFIQDNLEYCILLPRGFRRRKVLVLSSTKVVDDNPVMIHCSVLGSRRKPSSSSLR
nr:hypothetical protein CFP56_60780 [Quercus suber]